MREPPLGFERKCAAGVCEFFGDRLVVSRRSNDGDVVKILGGGADHGWPADVDVFDQLFKSYARLGGGFFEGVEIDHDHVDWLDAMLGDGGDVRGILAAMQDASVNSWDAAS